MNAPPRVPTSLLIALGAICLGASTGGFLTLILLTSPNLHRLFWVLVALLLGTMGYWMMSRAYFILEDRLQRALTEYEASWEEGHYSVRDILREEG